MLRGADPDGLERLERELAAVAESLDQVRAAVAADAPMPVRRLLEVEQWVVDQAGDLRRRRLALALDHLPDLTGIRPVLRREAWVLQLAATVPAVVGAATARTMEVAATAVASSGRLPVAALTLDAAGKAARDTGEEATSVLRAAARTLQRLAR